MYTNSADGMVPQAYYHLVYQRLRGVWVLCVMFCNITFSYKNQLALKGSIVFPKSFRIVFVKYQFFFSCEKFV